MIHLLPTEILFIILSFIDEEKVRGILRMSCKKLREILPPLSEIEICFRELYNKKKRYLRLKNNPLSLSNLKKYVSDNMNYFTILSRYLRYAHELMKSDKKYLVCLYGKSPKEKRELTVMINNPFIYRGDFISTAYLIAPKTVTFLYHKLSICPASYNVDLTESLSYCRHEKRENFCPGSKVFISFRSYDGNENKVIRRLPSDFLKKFRKQNANIGFVMYFNHENDQTKKRKQSLISEE